MKTEAKEALVTKRTQLERAEKAFATKARANAVSATTALLDKVAPLLPHCADRERFTRGLPPALQKRVCEVAAAAGCSAQNVLCNFFVDATAMGALSAAARTEIEQLMAVVCGSSGLATVVSSEVPANKGRPAAASAGGGAASAGAAASGDGLNFEGLPAAPGSYDMHKDRAQVNQLLAADFAKILTMSTSTDRYAEPVSFRSADAGSRAIRAVLFLPASSSPWNGMRLLTDLTLSVGSSPRELVELGGGAAAKARQGEVILKPRRDLNSKALRHQRGTAFFQAYFDDLSRAVASAEESTKSSAAVLFVDLCSWVGDAATALVDWWVMGQKAQSSPKVFGLFHDYREAAYLVTKCRRNEMVRGVFHPSMSWDHDFCTSFFHTPAFYFRFGIFWKPLLADLSPCFVIFPQPVLGDLCSFLGFFLLETVVGDRFSSFGTFVQALFWTTCSLFCHFL